MGDVTESASLIDRYLKTEELYDAVIEVIQKFPPGEIHSTPLRAALDRVLAQGKIEGRLTALAEATPRPAPLQLWRSRRDRADVIEIEKVVHENGEYWVWYHHTDPADTPSKALLDTFSLWYEPHGLRPDRLIEQWQAIVDSV